MILILEGAVMCFVLLLVCVIGIADEGPVGLVTFYEAPVQNRVVEHGLTTEEKIRRNARMAALGLYIPVLFLVPYMVYGLNGAGTFKEGFGQMTVIYLIMGLFDRLFIDWYWVGHTRAWEIAGTEDLKPYIGPKSLRIKWAGTLIGFPLLALLIAGLMNFFLHG